MVIRYEKIMPAKKARPAAKPKTSEQTAARSAGGPIKKDTPIANTDVGREKWEPEKEFTPPPIMVPPAVAARMQKEGVSMDGVEVQKKIPAPKNGKKPVQPVPAKPEGGKKLLSIRLDTDVIDAFKAQGKGWQGKINAALRQFLGL